MNVGSNLNKCATPSQEIDRIACNWEKYTSTHNQQHRQFQFQSLINMTFCLVFNILLPGRLRIPPPCRNNTVVNAHTHTHTHTHIKKENERCFLWSECWGHTRRGWKGDIKVVSIIWVDFLANVCVESCPKLGEVFVNSATTAVHLCMCDLSLSPTHSLTHTHTQRDTHKDMLTDEVA